MSDIEAVRSRLEADRRDLLDLTLRNPLLNYRPRVRGLEFVGESPRLLYRFLVVEGRSLAFAPAAAPPETEAATEGPEPIPDPPTSQNDGKLQTTLPTGDLADRLLAIHHAARTTIEEQGVNTLFLALGMLHWSEDPAGSRTLRAPLVLMPVSLTRTGVREWFRLRHDGQDPGANLSLMEKLRAEFGLVLPDLPDNDGHDLDPFFDAVAEVVRDRPGWSLDREAAVLGFFSFGKFLMYRDLDESSWPEGEGPAAQRIVASLLGDGFPGEEPALDEEERPERHPGYADLRLVLDADGSQTLALLDVADGRDLVIQGPPGTGKSQTITNLIADAIGRGKTVLFVAEKLAALEVVKRRLDAIGLGPACLELHSQKTAKRAVLDQLRRTLGRSRPRPGPAASQLTRRDELASRLDAYCEAINTPIGSSQVTPHEAIGALLHLRREWNGAAPPLLELPGAEDWSADDFRGRCEWVEQLQARHAMLDRLCEHPFFGSRRSAMAPGDEPALRERLQTASHAATALREAAAALAGTLRLPEAINRSACGQLVEAARRVADLARWGVPVANGDWQSRRSEVRELIEAGTALARLRDRFGAVLLPESWETDVLAIRQTLNAQGRHWWRWARPAYRRTVAQLAGLCKSEPPATLSDRLALLDAILDARRLREVIRQHEDLGTRLFGHRWRGDRSDWPALAEMAQGMYRLHLDVAEGRLPRGVLDQSADASLPTGLEALARAVEASLAAHRESFHRVLEFLDFDESARFGGEGGLAEIPFERQQDLLESWSRSTAMLDGLAALNSASERCRAAGLAGIVALAAHWEGADRLLGAAFRHAYYEALLRRSQRERPWLADFDGASHERLIEEYRHLDRLALAHAQSEIARAHWQRLPRHSGGGQLGTLRRELAKKARHLPVRQLMARAGNAIQATTPVFLMSPLSVAAYLPPGAIGFDLVIFDEASQVRPVDALGALLRARQAVVVGDGRQLPPTSFFDRLTGGDDAIDDDESSSDVESILGLFSAQGASERMLRWHYRSRHESLIAVSNREFYDGRLVVFPSPDAQRRESGLVFRHLPETVYDRGRSRTNPGEAEAVASAVMAFAREQLRQRAGDRLSLGVATFSAAQMQAIVERIERLRHDEPEIEEFFAEGAIEPFFIKNLENVQGDERDVIFISIGYGRTAEGTVSLNFGPLNGEGGERRLNVLITRARVRCEVFTNLTADDIDPSRTRSRGVQALRTFLAFARDGEPEGLPAMTTANQGPPSFEDALGALLESSGMAVRSRIGSAGCRIDLAVLDETASERYVLGVAADGLSYREVPSVRDRDRLRPLVLERLGWRLQRAWSPDWLRDPETAAAKLRATIPDGGHQPRETGQDDTLGPVEAIDSTEDPEPIAEPVGAPDIPAYRVAELPGLPAGNDLTAMPSENLAGLIADVVKIEGPVHASEVIRRLAESAGIRRLGSRIQEAIEAACSRAEQSGAIRREGDFFWPGEPTRPILRDRSRLPSASRRPEFVPTEELAMALERVARDAYGIEPASLPGAAFRLLGFPRLNDEMRRRAEALTGDLIATGRLLCRGEHLVARAIDTPI